MPQKKLQGVIASNKMQKTVVVKVQTTKFHAKYKRYYKTHKTFKAHVNDSAQYQVGQKVTIQECPPISKDKKFKVIA